MSDGSSRPTLNFIRDEAAASDSFGSHKRVASALAEVIATGRDLKVVGLLGPWGSGKSTVIRLTQAKLADQLGENPPYCFTYDAWLHQSDPPRRSFLENLIRDLIANKLTKPEKWKDRLEQLNRQVEETESVSTPMLATSGRWLILSLFLVPFGLQFASFEFLKAGYSLQLSPFEFWTNIALISLAGAPLLVAFILYLFRSKSDSEISILSIFMQKGVDINRHKISRFPDPTSIEFQDFFRTIVSDIQEKKRRLIIIIDNLDRLPELEAVSLWSTIRSFFLGAHSSGAYIPTVILPIDKDAVRRMYSVSHGADAELLARSFMDKTFDLTFYVPPPVLSGWQFYIEEKLTQVFGSIIEDRWHYIVSRIYERRLLNSESKLPTPREINNLVNRVGTIWLQWGERLSFSSITHYAVNGDTIDSDIAFALKENNQFLDDLDPEWRRSIAAIHFGVPPELAMQVVIAPALAAAIQNQDIKALRELADIPGFSPVFESVIEQSSSELAIPNGSGDAGPVFRLAGALSTANQESAWVDISWRRIRRALHRLGSWNTIETLDADNIHNYIRAADGDLAVEAIQLISQKISELPSELVDGAKFARKFATIADVLAGEAAHRGQTSVSLTVPGPATSFFDVARECSTAAFELIQPTDGPDEVAAKLVEFLPNEKRSRTVGVFAGRVRASDDRISWEPVVVGAGSVLEGNAITHANAISCLTILGRLQKDFDPAKSRLIELANSQTLANRMSEAVGGKLDGAITWITAAALAVSKPLSPEIWPDVLSNFPKLPADILSALHLFTNRESLVCLADVAKADAGVLPLVRTLVAEMISESALGVFDLSMVFGKRFDDFDRITEGSFDGFALALTTHANFEAEVGGAAFTLGFVRLMRSCLAAGGAQSALVRALLKRKLETLDQATWETALREGTEPLAFAADVLGPNDTLAGSLVSALKASLEVLYSDTGTAQLERWLEATRLLSASAQSTLFKYVADDLANGLLAVFDGQFLSMVAKYTSIADMAPGREDGLVRNVIVPMIEDERGIQVAHIEAPSLRSWVAGAPVDTRNFLVERLVHSRNVQPALELLIAELGRHWLLSLPEQQTILAEKREPHDSPGG